MSLKIKNARAFPKVYYGLHMVEGVAEYAEPGKDPYRIFIGETCLKNMDPSYQGKPVYVQHVDEVNLDTMQRDADGYVFESFYNKADGKHWVKFVVVSDKGNDAIARGWRLSNSYFPKLLIGGGLWHGVEYSKEITEGEYEHLAIVENPRYEESIILTPEEFKTYNEEKEAELFKLANSKDQKGETKMKFNLFKKTKVENSIDIEGMSVVLPKSKKEVSLEKLVNDADEMAGKKNSEIEADPEHMVKLHDGTTCNVGELLEKHKALNDELEEMKKKNDEESEEDDEKKNDDDEDADADKSNDDDDDDEGENPHSVEEEKGAKKKALEIAEHADEEIEAAKKKNEADKKAKAKEKAEKLRNANTKIDNEETQVVEFSGDMVERGKKRYGSN